MDFLSLAKTRTSVRTFLPNEIEDEKLGKILEAARIAPSAANFQPWLFYIFKTDTNKKILYEAFNRDWFKTAPVIIMACVQKDKAWVRPLDKKSHADIDIAIAVDHITLQAAELGLGTCWICNFNLNVLKQKFQLPENVEPMVLIPVGYFENEPELNRHETGRKKMNEIVFFEK